MHQQAYHPALLAAVQRNFDFFSGKRQYLVKIKLLGVDDNVFGVKAYNYVGAVGSFSAEDPNQPTVKEKIENLLEQLGEKTLMLEVQKGNIPDIIPKFKGRRGIFELTARSRREAQEQLEQIERLLGPVVL